MMELKKFFPIILMAAVLLVYISCGKQEQQSRSAKQLKPEEIHKIKNEIEVLIASDQFDKAYQKLEKSASVLDATAGANFHIELAAAWLNSGQADKALESAEAAIVFQPTHEMALVAKGVALKHLARDEEAVDLFEKALEQNRRIEAAHAQLADYYLENRNIPLAIKHYREASLIAPGKVPYHLRLTDLYRMQGKAFDAMIAAKTASAMSPHDFEIHRIYQDLSLSLGRREVLLRDYRRKVERTPDSGLAHYFYGRILQDPQAAKYELSTAASLLPDAFWPQYALGIREFLEDNYDQARVHMRKAAQNGTEEAMMAELYLGLIDIAEGRYEEAIAMTRQMIEESPGDFRPYTVLLDALVASGHMEEAEKVCLTLKEISSVGKSLAPVYEARIAAYTGNTARLNELAAKTAWQRLSPSSRQDLALILFEHFASRKATKKAFALLQESIKGIEVPQAKVLFWLGWAAEELEQSETAGESFERLQDLKGQRMRDEDLFYSDAGLFYKEEISAGELEQTHKYSSYLLDNDYWTVLGMKSLEEGDKQAARANFEKALEVTRNKEFPALLVQGWLEE
jgi:tetratricopeptide (TPR) repeat protein